LWNWTAYQQINYEWEQVFVKILNGEPVTKRQMMNAARSWECYFDTNDLVIVPAMSSEYFARLEAIGDALREMPPRERLSILTVLMDDQIAALYGRIVLEDPDYS
jgi:hypothetical protein